MFERILVPLDGSTRAAQAVPVAARIAGATNGTVILVSVVNHFVLAEPAFTSNNRAHPIEDISISEAETYLAEMADSPELAHVRVEKVLLSGPIASTLLSAATSRRTDLIVLTSHGRSGMVSKMLGSVAEKVVCRAAIPVLLLHDNNLLPSAPYVRPIRVLVALNGTAFGNTVLNPAAQLAAALASPYRGALHLARVVLPPEVVQQQQVHGPLAMGGEQAQKSLMTVTSYLNDGLIAPTVAQRGLAVTWTVQESERVAETLVRLAEKGEDAAGVGGFAGCDVIAMATYGLAGFQRLTLGCVPAQVMTLTRRPILFVRPTVQTHEDQASIMRASVV